LKAVRDTAALLVVLGGVASAAHVGKLPPALPVVREALGMSLVQAGFLLSLVQIGGMTLGLLAGLAADAIGLKRTMVFGLLLAGTASVLGGFVNTPEMLLTLRGIEGIGFLLGFMPAPALIRRIVPPERISGMLGLWGAAMALATGGALLLGPAFIAAFGWPGWWWLLGALSLAMGFVLWRVVPPDPPHGTADADWVGRVRLTVTSPGPWLVALAFGVYSGQWLAVIGFLPTIYLAAGVHPAWAAVATAIAAAVNMVGSIVSGRLLQRGWPAPRLLAIGYVVMGAGGFLAFSELLGDSTAAGLVRYAAVVAFSMVGGLVPGTLFSLAVRLAPSERTVSTTVGWMQQWSAFGQFSGPPLVAWVASRMDGWQWSWVVTGACACCGLLLAALSTRLVAARGH
jgi:MFS family permease